MLRTVRQAAAAFGGEVAASGVFLTCGWKTWPPQDDLDGPLSGTFFVGLGASTRRPGKRAQALLA